MQYIGEHLLIGQIGKSLIFISLIAVFISLLANLYSVVKPQKINFQLKILQKSFFVIHFLSVVLIICILLYLLVNNCFEYEYVWKHSSKSQGPEYKISALWAGQEGSLLVWIFWQSLLGMIIMIFSRKFKNTVMAMICLVQVFLMLLITGLDIDIFSFGSSPFTLLRECGDNINNPLFQNPDYLKNITDGYGLNPLLRNIWMVIHPPILFLGYALALMPFSYAIAGFTERNYKEWLRPALVYSEFCMIMLGAGLIFGGFWAYQSLSFGGFWSWDPVENSSLVPFLLIIATVHMIKTAQNNRTSVSVPFFLSVFTYVIVLYASYLTRSGILSEFSVHAFTGNESANLFMALLIVFIVLSFVIYIYKRKHILSCEEPVINSREFWIISGVIVLLLSAFQITVTTSMPVINRIFGTSFAPVSNQVSFYNRWQSVFAFFIGITIIISQFYKYGRNEWKIIFRRSVFPFALSLIISIAVYMIYGFTSFNLFLLFLICLFILFASFELLLRIVNGVVNKGAIFTHMGFAIFIIGLIIAFSKPEVIMPIYSKAPIINTNLVLTQNVPVETSLHSGLLSGKVNTDIVYTGSAKKWDRDIFNIDFIRKNEKGDYNHCFSLHPSILINQEMGNVYQPDIAHFWNRDVFTHIAGINSGLNNDGLGNNKIIEIKLHDTITEFSIRVVFSELKVVGLENKNAQENVEIRAKIILLNKHHLSDSGTVCYIVRNNILTRKDFYSDNLKTKVIFYDVSPAPNKIRLMIAQKGAESIILRVIVFPYISLLWIGSIMMLLGLLISVIKNIRLNKSES